MISKIAEKISSLAAIKEGSML